MYVHMIIMIYIFISYNMCKHMNRCVYVSMYL